MRLSNLMLVKLIRPQRQFQFFPLLFKTESRLLRRKIGLKRATRPREHRKEKFFYEQNNIFEGASLSSPLSASSLSSLFRNFSSICQLTWFTILHISRLLPFLPLFFHPDLLALFSSFSQSWSCSKLTFFSRILVNISTHALTCQVSFTGQRFCFHIDFIIKLQRPTSLAT